MHSVYDSIILGSGISGLSLAYWLKKNKWRHRVLVIDAYPFLHGASAKNAGFLTVGSLDFYKNNMEEHGTYLANEILDFCQTNHELLHKSGLLGASVDYRYAGSYSITSTDFDGGRHQKSKDCDFPLNLGEYSYFYPMDGSVNSVKLLHHMKSQLNVDFAFETAVATNFSSSKISIDGKSISYKRLFVATNSWLNTILDAPNIQPVRAQIFRSRPIKKRFEANYYFTDDLIYLRQETSGNVMVGGKRLLDKNTENTSKEQINEKIQRALLEFARERVDSSIEVESSWSGIMGYTSDGMPKVGKIGDNVLFQAGFSGHGMGMAFYLAKLVTQWAWSRTPPRDIPACFFNE